MRREVQQSDFANALIDPESPVPPGVVDPFGDSAPKRFATYRNNVTVSLLETMRSIFPAVEALIGPASFRDLALNFVRSTPPQSPILAEYGEGFAEFLAAKTRLQRWPFLPDIARLERNWLRAYHAEDRKPLDPSGLGSINEHQWPTARFVTHPATRLLPSVFPIVDIWNAAKVAKSAPRIDPNSAQWALVVRPAYEVSVHQLDSDAGMVVAGLIDGLPLGDAVGRHPRPDEIDLGGLMQNLLSVGAFWKVELD